MGKKSKRVRGAAGRQSSSGAGDGGGATKRRQPDDDDADAAKAIGDVLDEMEENVENLRFQDPFIDEYEEEDVISESDGGDDDDEDGDQGRGATGQRRDDPKLTRGENERPRAWVPSLGLDANKETLEIDLRAYRMHHALTAEWPSLSVDFVRDDFGGGGGGAMRTRFPHSMIAVAGTQAPPGERNGLTVMKMTDLWGTGSRRRGAGKGSKDDSDDDDSDDSDDDSDDSDSDDSDDDERHRGDDPVLEHASLPHEGGVNRVRVMPSASSPDSSAGAPEFLTSRRSIVATWSDLGAVNLYDLTPTLSRFERSSGRFSSSSDAHALLDDGNNGNNTAGGPFFTNDGHKTEGYALAWSAVNPGHLVSGDCAGEIDLYQPTESSFSVTRAAYGPSKKERKAGAGCSVEDAQWSPTEATVFATGESGGKIRIYDTRRHGKAMLTTKAATSADVNVIGWNHMVSNLLCSGDDDGVFACWDLRTFGGPSGGSGGGGGGGGKKEQGGVDPLARFAYDRGSPITSLDWHPTDESMVLVTDENYTYVYDLSVEADDDDAPGPGLPKGTPEGGDAIPPQLLFLHCGSEHTKEARWHPQISSCVMTTALNGFSVFIPSNL